MKLPARQMHELNDAQLNFEALQKNGVVDSGALAAGVAAANVGALGGVLSGTLPNPGLAVGRVLELATTGTTRAVDFGNSNFVFTASSASAAVVVNHNLGRTPAFAVAQIGGGAFDTSAYFTNRSTTTATFQAGTTNGTSITVTVAFFWLVIG